MKNLNEKAANLFWKNAEKIASKLNKRVHLTKQKARTGSVYVEAETLAEFRRYRFSDHEGFYGGCDCSVKIGDNLQESINIALVDFTDWICNEECKIKREEICEH